MRTYSIEDVKATLLRCAALTREIEDRLTEIDSLNGDGDLGVSMAKGMEAIEKTVSAFTGTSVSQLFLQCGMAFNRAAPSTMGTLIGMSFMSVGNAWKNVSEIGEAEIAALPSLMAEAIAKFGNAKPGDKTVLDALCPFAQTLKSEYEASGNFAGAYALAVEAAKAGMESTKGMQPRVGRARWLGERAIQNYDGGAVLCAYLLEKLQ